ncbi:YceD family protein [Balneatrix alpica]|uniref:Large ribosomal RNA subunit accumulation protein YceD n=1 Tax=Balneatrix alpica TaxID=75684 RepID=A0ABV5ZA76_9GAMM|nr:YceD family protein [Balneatrix alpica]
MSNQAFPAIINPRKWAEKGFSWSGELPLSHFARLCESLQGSEGAVKAQLQFGVDEEGLRYMRGQLQTQVTLICQRCLTPVVKTLETELSMGMAWHDEAAAALPSYYDPMIVSEEQVELLPVLEDELILALPLVAMHDDCEVQTEFGEPVQSEVDERPASNPFAVLAQLKK